MASLTDSEFQAKHNVSKPYDACERDMLIKSNLSDIQQMIAYGQLQQANDRCNALKSFMIDTRDFAPRKKD